MQATGNRHCIVIGHDLEAVSSEELEIARYDQAKEEEYTETTTLQAEIGRLMAEGSDTARLWTYPPRGPDDAQAALHKDGDVVPEYIDVSFRKSNPQHTPIKPVSEAKGGGPKGVRVTDSQASALGFNGWEQQAHYAAEFKEEGVLERLHPKGYEQHRFDYCARDNWIIRRANVSARWPSRLLVQAILRAKQDLSYDESVKKTLTPQADEFADAFFLHEADADSVYKPAIDRVNARYNGKLGEQASLLTLLEAVCVDNGVPLDTLHPAAATTGENPAGDTAGDTGTTPGATNSAASRVGRAAATTTPALGPEPTLTAFNAYRNVRMGEGIEAAKERSCEALTLIEADSRAGVRTRARIENRSYQEKLRIVSTEWKAMQDDDKQDFIEMADTRDE